MTADADSGCGALSAWLAGQWGPLYPGDPFPLQFASPVGVAASRADLHVFRSADGRRRLEVSDMWVSFPEEVRARVGTLGLSEPPAGGAWRLGDTGRLSLALIRFRHAGSWLDASVETTRSTPGVLHWRFFQDGRVGRGPDYLEGQPLEEIRAQLIAWSGQLPGR